MEVLAEAGVPIEQMAIVGCDLRLLEGARGGERITNRPLWLRAAGYGAISGAWLGALVGIIFGVLASTGTGGFLSALLWGIIVGALFGAPAGLAGSLAVGRPRGLAADQRLVAARYDLYAPAEGADEVRSALLRRRPSGTRLVDGTA
jgi:hypothetical protein